ncbi:hypothetical protein PF011_g27178 [Phytophthora fragariae]|uniref:Uncharacterized protein n=1 Tax=Phytophthora fragariae TaxID=53985 RepID=A0A6A3HEI7_9STRA|nr:hypothetical protein PF011_g27178 [Phytophthora fragariae]
MIWYLRFAVPGVLALFVVSESTAETENPKTPLADASPVKFHVTLRRKAMELHGESEFDVFANPVAHSRFTYSLVDGAAYLVTNDSSSNAASVRCIPPSTLPFGRILPALNHATHIPSASIGDQPVECESGNLFKTTFAGVHYAICSSGEDGFTALASNLTIDVEYLDKPVSISTPKLSDGSSCKALAKPTSVTPTALALIT